MVWMFESLTILSQPERPGQKTSVPQQKQTPLQQVPISKQDPLEILIAQQKKGRILLTEQEEKQLKELEKKENRVRAEKAVEYLVSNPQDYRGGCKYFSDLSSSRQDEIIKIMADIVHHYKGDIQKSCRTEMSEESFCKLKQAHDRYQMIESSIMQGQNEVKQNDSTVDSAYQLVMAYVNYVPTKTHLCAIALGSFLLGRILK